MALFGRSLCASRSLATAVAAALKNQGTTAKFTPVSVRCASSLNRQLRTEDIEAPQVSFSPVKSIDVDELHRLRQDDENNLILVDVRELSEIGQSTNYIPGCINIPLGSIQRALSLNRCEFRKKYRKPMDINKLVFVCRIGNRSALAAEHATKLGCTEVRFLQGGFEAYLNRVGNTTNMTM